MIPRAKARGKSKTLNIAIKEFQNMDNIQQQLEQELAEYSRQLEFVEKKLAELRQTNPFSAETARLKQERNDLEEKLEKLHQALQQRAAEEQIQASAPEEPYQVFLSFHSKDRAAVQKIAIHLQDQAQLRPWLDEWDLIPGEDWIDGLYNGLSKSETCAVFIGKNGQGPWQDLEVKNVLITRINEQGFRLIPVLLPDAAEDLKLPHFLPAKMWVDFRGKALNDDDALWRLECGIRGDAPGRGRPAPLETSPAGSLSNKHAPVLPAAEIAALQQDYLHWVCGLANQVSLVGIDRKAAAQERETCLELGAIYTALLTREAEHPGKLLPSREGPGVGSLSEAEQGRDRRLSAVAQLNNHVRLVLLGDPGSGKSTFVNFVALCLAGELLEKRKPTPGPSQEGKPTPDPSHEGKPTPDPSQKGKPTPDPSHEGKPTLRLLTAPLPKDDGEDEEERQPWALGNLLPVRVILRDFAARGLPPAGQSARARHIWEFIAKELAQAGLGAYAPYLQQHLRAHGGLLLLDGLDEVPEADQRRSQIKQAVEEFVQSAPRCRIVVTSRTYAYQQQDWRLQSFAETVLAPFSQGQIRRFVERWYAHVGQLRGLNAEDVQGRAELLKRAILSSERLYSLAERPLLLTLMASLHAWRGGSLPEKREELYNDTVELLLEVWERPKVVRDEQGNIIIAQESLTELLRAGNKEQVKKALNFLAYQAHQGQVELTGTADIGEQELVTTLMRLSQNKDLRPARLIEYLRDRAGLLMPRGVGVYTFPHRTFQEYLSACYLTEDQEFPDNIAQLARKEPNRWREVVLLAGAKATRGSASAIWNLAEALCFTDCPFQNGKPSPVPSQKGNWSEDAWGALLAAQAIVETNYFSQVAPRNQAKLKRLQKWLIAIMTEQVSFDSIQGTGTFTPFPAVERTLAGDLLALLGDPRPGVGCRSLSGVEGSMRLPDIAWCEVPAGPFFMGGDPTKDQDIHGNEQPQHEVQLPTYQIGRYLITNAQYQAFVADGGYTDRCRQCWPNEGWQWKVHTDLNEPKKKGGMFDLPNHPVINISWYEAVAFCHWLTIRLYAQGELADQQMIRLPSEAEWEKAARGADACMYSRGNTKVTLEPTNYEDTILGVTSTVGCFPRGISPYSCEDMASTVYEWCADSWHYNYKGWSVNNRIWKKDKNVNLRLSRYGSWNFGLRWMRYAFRHRFILGAGVHYGGFRIVRVQRTVEISDF